MDQTMTDPNALPLSDVTEILGNDFLAKVCERLGQGVPWSDVHIKWLLNTACALQSDLSTARAGEQAAKAEAAVLYNALNNVAINRHFKISADGPDIPNGLSCELCGVECEEGETLIHSDKCIFRSAPLATALLARVERCERAVTLTLPLMQRYEGQGEGGMAEFNIAMQALHHASAAALSDNKGT